MEETFYPRNPLDVLAQQIVAIASMDPTDVDDLYAQVRRAAPFADLPRSSFEGVLDMLSGRYPSDEFAELRPRVTWDRVGGRLRAREGAKRVAVVNAGTIPDRGLYGVFLAGEEGGRSRRVGELDEEMVFESRPGDVFLLGASSWRIDQITHDRVIVTPAPGEPGKMPFWHGDRPGRPVEFGKAIGALARELVAEPRRSAAKRCGSGTASTTAPRTTSSTYLHEQAAATGEVPSDRVIVVERYVDEIGDWRVCILSPFGARVHAPWGTAVAAALRQRDRSGRRDDLVRRRDGLPAPGMRRTPRRLAGSCPTPTRSRTGSSAASATPPCSRRDSGRTPRGRCSCRAAIRAAEARSGRSANAQPTCSPWRAGTAPSR